MLSELIDVVEDYSLRHRATRAPSPRCLKGAVGAICSSMAGTYSLRDKNAMQGAIDAGVGGAYPADFKLRCHYRASSERS